MKTLGVGTVKKIFFFYSIYHYCYSNFAVMIT